MTNHIYYNNLANITFPDFKCKESIHRHYVIDMLTRTQSMIRIEGLPETIPERALVRMLQTGGVVAVTEVNDKLYAFNGGIGGEPDPYYLPTVFTVSNPALDFSKNLEIGKDCVLIRHDTYMRGLLPICNHYAAILTECDMTIRRLAVTTRMPWWFSASDDADANAVNVVLKGVEDGNNLATIVSEGFANQVQSSPLSTGGQEITRLIELRQYIRASWYNDLGLNANYNMKREAINTTEAQLNDEALLPLTDDIMQNLRDGFAECNAKYGTNIRVTFGQPWDQTVTETEDVTEEVIMDDNADDQGSVSERG